MSIGEGIFWAAVLTFAGTMIATGYGYVLLIPIVLGAIFWLMGR